MVFLAMAYWYVYDIHYSRKVALQMKEYRSSVLEENLVKEQHDQFERERLEQEQIESSRGEQRPAAQIYDVTATSYTISDSGMNGKGVTATGHKAVPWSTIAVDPNIIPLGSKIHLHCEEYPSMDGEYIADDVGGAIHGYHIDVCVETKSQAIKLGKRKVQLTIER
jgi:3D (Asp-Asp-Asp) domain-containing protein